MGTISPLKGMPAGPAPAPWRKRAIRLLGKQAGIGIRPPAGPDRLSRFWKKAARVKPGYGGWWITGEVLLAVLVAVFVASLPWYLAVPAAAFIALVLVMLFRSEWVPFLWIFGVALVPSWVMWSSGGIEIYPVVGLTLAAGLHVVDRALPRLRWADIPVLLYSALVILALTLGSPKATVGTELIQVGAAYFIGRFVLSADRKKAARVFVVCMTIFAGLALVEFITRWNPMVAVPSPNPVLSGWRNLQTRGGIPRAEWSFGHSISLGACLAMAIPLVSSTGWTIKRQLGAAALLYAAVLATVSRGPLIAAALGVILAARRRPVEAEEGSVYRHALPVITVLALSAAAIPAVLLVSRQAGSELVQTTAYRQQLLAGTWSWARPLGLAEFGFSEGHGGVHYAQFDSVDNAFLNIALNSGYVPALLLFGLVTVHFIRAVLGKAGTWETVVAAQLPLLMTVAFITQLQAFFWMAEGLALAEIIAARDASGAAKKAKEPASPIAGTAAAVRA